MMQKLLAWLLPIKPIRLTPNGSCIYSRSFTGPGQPLRVQVRTFVVALAGGSPPWLKRP